MDVWFEIWLKLYVKGWERLHLCGSIQQKKPSRLQDQQHKPISYTRKHSSGVIKCFFTTKFSLCLHRVQILDSGEVHTDSFELSLVPVKRSRC